MEGEMWKRQKDLENIEPPKKAVVIGVGGIGSWIAYFLARIGIEELIIADPDEIELHNLNRTPFRADQIGDKKVYALEELIYEFRDDIKVKSIPEYVLDYRKEFDGADVIIDARDTTAILPFADLKVTYDGEAMTLWVKPGGFIVMGEGSGYTTVPSYVVPPVLLASLVVHMVSSKEWKDLKKPAVATATVSGLIKSFLGGKGL